MSHIAISGIIGAGKTTLAENLGKILNIPVYYESAIDSEELTSFYDDMKSNAFSLQISLLNKRFSQHQRLIWGENGGIQDRSIYEDDIFARMFRDTGMIREKDYEVYRSLFINISKMMSVPNVIIHLDVSPEESLRRIQKRGREYEKNITLEYLITLYNYYSEFVDRISNTIRVIRINWTDSDDIISASHKVAKELKAARLIVDI